MSATPTRDRLFLAALQHARLPAPTLEWRFAPPRRWRFDFAWAPWNVALEVEGGIWTRGRHTRGAGFLRDMEKYNHAALLDWRVLRTTPTALCSKGTLTMIRQALSTRRGAA